MTRLESRAGAIQLQDFQYDYEDRGLLTRRVDGLLGRSDELVYDELRHLRTLGERGAAVRERYSMDEIGNLTATHDGELHYLDPAHPYAATEIDGPNGGSFRYDAVGNAYRARDLEIAYTQRNLPRTIDSDKTGLVRYTYDAGGGRASKRGRDTDITYFGLYELERRGMQLYERLSIDTPVGVVAQVERGAQSGPNGPGSRLRWLLVERQGSVETTWVSGESPQHIQYDAYGGVLTSGGSASGERPGATVSQGYTSHEHEDDVELINMGGRVYSPRLRRFLTADPVVANPVGQGLNAYTYVAGDPFNLIDPSGWYIEGVTPDNGTGVTHGSDSCGECNFEDEVVLGKPTGVGDSHAAERPSSGASGQGSASPGSPATTVEDRRTQGHEPTFIPARMASELEGMYYFGSRPGSSTLGEFVQVVAAPDASPQQRRFEYRSWERQREWREADRPPYISPMSNRHVPSHPDPDGYWRTHFLYGVGSTETDREAGNPPRAARYQVTITIDLASARRPASAEVQHSQWTRSGDALMQVGHVGQNSAQFRRVSDGHWRATFSLTIDGGLYRADRFSVRHRRGYEVRATARPL